MHQQPCRLFLSLASPCHPYHRICPHSLHKLKHLSGLPVYELVEREVVGFQAALPLMKELKSDALRKRHWASLMEVTGQNFDMDPKTFTLGNMFSMQVGGGGMACCSACLKLVLVAPGGVSVGIYGDVWMFFVRAGGEWSCWGMMTYMLQLR